MLFPEALEWLYSLQSRGIRLGLDRVHALLERLGRPQDSFASILVGGTVGKGSTAALIEAALRSEGYRSGLYLSPHLNRFAERIQIDGHPCPDAQIARAVAQVRPHVEAMGNTGQPLTFFEAVTAAALVALAERRVEVAVLEVGLGGRLDATNAVEPLASVITPLGKDHWDRLGGSLEAAAGEKAGILRPGAPAILAGPDPGRSLLRSHASRVGCRTVEVDARQVRAVEVRATGTTFTCDAWGHGRRVELAMLGRHQCLNALAAIRTLESMGRFRVLPENALRAFAQVRMPGRLEPVPDAMPPLIVDGAHNPPSMEATVEFVHGVWAESGVDVLFGALEDKPVPELLAHLQPICRRLTATTVPNQRALDPATIAQHACAMGFKVRVEADADAALRAFQASADCPRLITGSLFLAARARKQLMGVATDSLPMVPAQ